MFMKDKKNQGLSRTEYLIKNASLGVLGKLLGILLTFVSRTIFIYYLGKSYLGVNSLYYEILSLLSFAELGFGGAITYSLYEPLANNDTQRVVQLIDLFKRVYRIVAFVILTLGLLLIPFLQYIVKDADRITLHELRLYFVISLLNTVSTYFVVYKNNLIIAQQKEYLIKKIHFVTDIISFAVQMISLVIFKNYLAYLLSGLIMTLLVRAFISRYLNRIEPVLTIMCTQPLPKDQTRGIYKNVSALAVNKIASVAVNATDNIIISMTAGLGVIIVGTVSNYVSIITSITAAISMIFGTVTAGFGNLVALSSDEHYHESFKEINFINFWIYGFAMIACFVLLSPFVSLWLGADFLIGMPVLLLIVLSRYLLGQISIYNLVRAAKGEFSRDAWVSFAEAIINLIVSIIAAQYFGLAGIYIGTLTARSVQILFRVTTTHKFLFGKPAVSYFKQFFAYLATVFLAGAVTYFATCKLLMDVTILTFGLAVIITAIVPNAIFAVLFWRTKVLKKVIIRMKMLLHRK